MSMTLMLKSPRAQALLLVLFVMAIMSFYFLHDITPKLTPTSTIRKRRPVDTSSIVLDDLTKKKVWTDNKLRPLISRGATIFVDGNGSVRIPAEDIVNKMEFRDLEELYHRSRCTNCTTVRQCYSRRNCSNDKKYIESIQTICPQQIHLGRLDDGGYDLCQDEAVLPSQPCLRVLIRVSIFKYFPT